MCIYVGLLTFRVAQIDVWSANFLFGSEVEINWGWALFGLDLERAVGMVWEQLMSHFSVGSGCMPCCDGIGGNSTLSFVQSAASIGCECDTGLKPCGRLWAAQLWNGKLWQGPEDLEDNGDCCLLSVLPDKISLGKTSGTELTPWLHPNCNHRQCFHKTCHYSWIKENELHFDNRCLVSVTL